MNSTTLEPLPIGYTNRGNPVWPMSGGAPDGDPDGGDPGTQDATGAGDAEGAPGDDGGDSGSNLSPEEQSKVAEARADAAKVRLKLKPWAALQREFGTPEEIRERLTGSAPSAEIEQVRTEATTRVEKMRQQVVAYGVRALASTEFADPDDAVRLLDLREFEVDENGQVDESEVREALTNLLDRKPHLRKVVEKQRRAPLPDPSQGNPPKSTPKGSLEAGRERMRQYTGRATTTRRD